VIRLSSLLVAGLLVSFPAQAETPNVLLIVAEDLGPRSGAFGDSVAQTPRIDRLAEQGVRESSRPGKPAILVDLDPGGLGPVADRLANLTRLVRSYRKSRCNQIPALQPGEGFRFMYGVTGGKRQLLKRLLKKARQLLDPEEWKR